MRWARRHTRVAARVLVALGGVALVAAGFALGERELIALGGPLLGWALPYLRELVLDRELQRAIEELDEGVPAQNVKRRLRRVSNAPPREPQ